VPEQQPTGETAAATSESINAHIDLRRARPSRHGRDEATMLATIAAGGATGAAARYLIEATWPTPPGTFPLSTMAINLLGCALMGVLMVLTTEVWGRQRLISPFLGIGVLGGFTTFSTYTVDIQRLIAGGQVDTALVYLCLTPVGALLAVWVTAKATRRLVSWRLQ
jgi:CrcB protein